MPYGLRFLNRPGERTIGRNPSISQTGLWIDGHNLQRGATEMRRQRGVKHALRSPLPQSVMRSDGFVGLRVHRSVKYGDVEFAEKCASPRRTPQLRASALRPIPGL